MKYLALAATLLSSVASLASPAAAQETKVTPLLTNDIKGVPGKEAALLLVEYDPGASDPVHRHNALAYVYVLEGSIVMQVRGGKEETLGPGQTFVERPDDVHLIGRNASTTEPAKFLAFFIKESVAPPVLPAN